MVRRLQLMEPEPRGFGSSITDAAARLRDGMLWDNKVLPPVLAALALIIFAWLLAGVIIGDPGEGERVARQAAQPSVAQAPENGGGSSETPAPSVENRDSESIDVYESKDPFRELFPSADSNNDAAGGDTTGDDAGGDGAGSGTDPSGSDDGTEGGTGSGGSDGNGSGFGNGPGDGSGSDSDQYGGDGGEDFLDQTSPGDPGFEDGNGFGDGSGSGNGGGSGDGGGSGGNGGGSSGSEGGSGGGSNGSGGGSGGGNGGGSGTSGGQYGDGDGNGNLFDSGGKLDR